MKAHQAEHSISLMCRVLGLSRSGYYAWLGRGPSDRDRADRRLTSELRRLHLESRGIYGAPRLHAQLGQQGTRVSRKRVARLMREAGICGVTRRKRWRTTKRDPNRRPAPDLVERDFTASGPNQLWVADITHIPTKSGALYLAVVVDVWSRKVVGWATAQDMPAELVVSALEMAVARRRPRAGVIHHSDQGSQYTSAMFKGRCEQLGVRVSMGSVGDCYDNAMAESFFATLEAELLDIVAKFADPDDADRQVFAFIEGFYNTRRLHGGLEHRSPTQFEAEEFSAAIHNDPQVASLPPDPPRPSPIGSEGS